MILRTIKVSRVQTLHAIKVEKNSQDFFSLLADVNAGIIESRNNRAATIIKSNPIHLKSFFFLKNTNISQRQFSQFVM